MRKNRLILLLALWTIVCCVYGEPLTATLKYGSELENTAELWFEDADTTKNGGEGVGGANKQQKKADQMKAERKRQYSFFLSFMVDSLQYKVKNSTKHKTRDAEIQYWLDSINSCINSLDVKLNALDKEMKEVEKANETVDARLLWIRILSYSLTLLLIAFIIYFILYKRGTQEDVEKLHTSIEDVKRRNDRLKKNVDIVVESSDRLKKQMEKNVNGTASSSSSNSYTKTVEELQKENNSLKDRVAQLEKAIQEWKKDAESIVSSRTKESQNWLYADSIIEGVFSHVWEKENEDTVFVLKQKDGAHASITLSKQAYKKILANASYLDGCEKQIVGYNTVDIIDEGKAEKRGDGKWRVISPLKVELR